ncbi:hypothetical protein [Embleya sp. NPDC005575]
MTDLDRIRIITPAERPSFVSRFGEIAAEGNQTARTAYEFPRD